MSRRGCTHFLSSIRSGVQVMRDELGLFQFSFSPIKDFYINVNEAIEFSAPVDEVLGCRMPPPSLSDHAQRYYLLRGGERKVPLYPLISVAVSSVTQPVYAGGAGEAGRVTAMFSLLGAPFGVPGINYVTVLSMMHCTPDATRRALGYYRGISVATIEDSFYGVMIGNLIITCGVLLVHFFVILSLKWKCKGSWTRTAERCFFPGIPLLFLVNLFVGTSFASLQGLSSKVGSTLVLSIVMLLLFVGGLIVVLCVSMAKARLTFYPILSLEGTTLLSKNSFMSMLAAGWLLRVGGFWLPATVANGFFLLLMNLRRSRVVWVTLWLWAPLVVAVFAALPAQTAAGCIAIHVVLILCHLIFFGAVAVFRPLISPLDNGYYLLVVLVSVWLLAADTELLLHPDNEPALFAACTAAIVAIAAFFVYIVLKTLQVIAFARRKWAGADVRGAAGTRYREPNQTALFNLPTGGQKQPEMSPSSSSTAPPAAGPPLVVPHVQNLVERTVGGDPRDRILPGQQLSTVLLNELTTDNAVVALEFARPVVPLRDTRTGGATQRAAFPRWSSFGSLSLDSLESIDLDVWSVGGGRGGGGGPV
ncbi:hypothetical protein TcG_07838 [Trypanosoma cruzi]|nr:hypothetical protein TcG_07838 [Trypanosoma cruzi]